MHRTLALSAAFAALCLPALFGQANAIQLSNRRAPSWALPDTRMQTHDLLDYRGKWLIVMFMDTSCAKCKPVSRSLDVLRVKHKDRLDVVSVVIPPENLKTVGTYITETKITYPVLFDSSQMAITYFKATPDRATFDRPHLFAIDPNGWIVRDWGDVQAVDANLPAEIEKLINTNAKK